MPHASERPARQPSLDRGIHAETGGRAGRSSLAILPALGQDPRGQDMTTGSDALRQGSNGGHAPTARVLVADPGEIVRDAIARVLEQDGRFEVCATAADAAGTVAAAVAAGPDICLIETVMPGGGLAAAWEVTARLPDTRVVILTSRDSDEELLEALEIGVSGYLLKTAVLGWLPNTLMDVHCGTFALPRRLTHRVVRRLRTREPRRRSIVGQGSRLTSREWEVLDLIARGLSTRDVAEQLTLSSTAIRVHIASAVRKLGDASRAEAIALFTRPAELGGAAI
jgi:DNA-binding NarL/FixJ family response regulator